MLLFIVVFIFQDILGLRAITLLIGKVISRCGNETNIWPSDLNDWMGSLKPLPLQVSLECPNTLSCLKHPYLVCVLHLAENPFLSIYFKLIFH